jgi:hypothetical protein
VVVGWYDEDVAAVVGPPAGGYEGQGALTAQHDVVLRREVVLSAGREPAERAVVALRSMVEHA